MALFDWIKTLFFSPLAVVSTSAKKSFTFFSHGIHRKYWCEQKKKKVFFFFLAPQNMSTSEKEKFLFFFLTPQNMSTDLAKSKSFLFFFLHGRSATTDNTGVKNHVVLFVFACPSVAWIVCKKFYFYLPDHRGN